MKDKLNLISVYNTLGIQFIAGLVRQIEMHINRQTHLETDRQTDRQTNKQTDRHTYRQTCIQSEQTQSRKYGNLLI